MDNDYITINLSDILRGAMKAHQDGNEEISNELKKIYFKSTDNTMIFHKDTPIVRYLEKLDKEQKHIFIDANILLNALGIAKAKYNYKIEKKLNSYYKAYMDTIRDGKNDIDIIAKILSDEEVITFIDENYDFEKYVSELRNNAQKVKEKEKVKIIGIPEAA